MIARTTAAGLALLALGVSGLDLDATLSWTYQTADYHK